MNVSVDARPQMIYRRLVFNFDGMMKYKIYRNHKTALIQP
jgi:hypothetical protein